MTVTKRKLGDIPRCYAVAGIVVDGETALAFASEGEGGPCYAFSGKDFEKRTTVWEHGGGTMSFVPIPGRENEFLATQNFFPGFDAGTSKVVWGRFRNGGWEVRDYITIPYLHRFDLLEAGGVNYFIGATLCTSKSEREDWSDPGKIFTGVLPGDWDEPMEIVAAKEGLLKNHGYWRGSRAGRPASYVACDSGVWICLPPETPGAPWEFRKLMDRAVSDIGVFDLDGDGEEEYALLYPFHGNNYAIVKKDGADFRTVYSYPKTPSLSHAVWTGMLNGRPALVGGYRQDDAELFVVRYNRTAGEYETRVLESGGGPTNVAVIHTPDGDVIASANKQYHEAAIYRLND